MRIALFGGSFNPPHIGHVLAASHVLATHEPDQLWVMPAFRHPFGKPLAPFEDRVRMCELAFANLIGRVVVSRIEAEVDGDGTTVTVLEHLMRRFHDVKLSLVIGADILPERPKWKDFARISELAEVIAIGRAGYPGRETGLALPEVSSTEIRARLSSGEPVAGLVPASVATYIRMRGLY